MLWTPTIEVVVYLEQWSCTKSDMEESISGKKVIHVLFYAMGGEGRGGVGASSI